MPPDRNPELRAALTEWSWRAAGYRSERVGTRQAEAVLTRTAPLAVSKRRSFRGATSSVLDQATEGIEVVVECVPNGSRLGSTVVEKLVVESPLSPGDPYEYLPGERQVLLQ